MKVAPEDILKVQFPRFTTLDLRPTNTDISMAVAGLLTFFNSSTSCLICAQADCKYYMVSIVMRLSFDFLYCVYVYIHTHIYMFVLCVCVYIECIYLIKMQLKTVKD